MPEATRWTDADMLEDVRLLSELVQRSFRVLSSVEAYCKEAAAGRLAWGPAHTEKFFRDHNKTFAADDFRLLKTVGGLLASSDDAVTIAVALNDMGEFMRFFPQGRAIVSNLGLKAAIMAHLAHPDEAVQKQAVVACSKMMISSWEFVSA